jgi:uncharacterized repeat protein (TIGR03837 family)
MRPPSQRWDIFCAVVDNYGDAGIAWRLARMLASEHGLPVRLYVDALPTLARLVPSIDPARDRQRVAGVEVCTWGGPRADLSAQPGAVVIEAFGCGLPDSYLQAMAGRNRPPVWINLEYLSAERWIEDCHGLASRHPTLPLTRHFFFPGFTPASGGLLRERDLLSWRDRFRADRASRATLWREIGVAEPVPESLLVSLFCYPNAPVSELLDTWMAGGTPIHCVVAQAVAESSLVRWAKGAVLRPGERLVRGALTLVGMPFVAQDDYDRVLWACELNFVRGEDSFVRAQWAARPLVWNVYPQSEDAHRLKLEAFLNRYCAGMPREIEPAFRAFSHAWNGDGDVRGTWPRFADARAASTRHAEAWAAALAHQRELASALAKFCLDRL